MRKRTLSIRKNSDGTVTIFAQNPKYVESIDIRELYPEEKYEKIKWAILTAGFAFSEEVERMVREQIWD